jgi:N-acetylneuraminic acid mutarotase
MKAKHASQRDHFTTQRILLAAAIFFLPLAGHGADGGAWVRKADMPTARMGLSTCTVDGIVYAIGGSLLGSGTALATVEAYDPATDLWTTKAAMPNARLYPDCAVVNGRIYAMGGDLHGIIPVLQSPLSIVHEYDPATDTWTRKADMPTARWGLTVAVVDEKIYALGGYTAYGTTPLSVLEVYDPATDTWESKAAMPTPRGWFTTSVVDGKIFAIGAAQPPSGPWLATVDMYDPLTDTWTPKANMPTARGALASSVTHGLIYVVGGRTGNPSFRAFSTVEEYDPATDTWTERTSLPSPRFHFRTSELNGRIYAIGGASATGQSVEAVLSLVHEYTLPVTTPVLKLNRATWLCCGLTGLRSKPWRSTFCRQCWTQFARDSAATAKSAWWNIILMRRCLPLDASTRSYPASPFIIAQMSASGRSTPRSMRR